MDDKPICIKGFVVLCQILALVALLTQCSREAREPTATPAPDFILKTLDHQEITLSKLRGKAVLLDFWATWCGPCRESIPHLVQIYKTYQANGLEVIGMNLDKGNQEAVRHFVQSMDIPYPIAITPEEVSRNYGVMGLPTTILIDKQGKIREKIMGFNSTLAKKITEKVEELTSEKF